MPSSNDIPSSSTWALTRREKGVGIDGHAAYKGADEMFMIKLHRRFFLWSFMEVVRCKTAGVQGATYHILHTNFQRGSSGKFQMQDGAPSAALSPAFLMQFYRRQTHKRHSHSPTVNLQGW